MDTLFRHLGGLSHMGAGVRNAKIHLNNFAKKMRALAHPINVNLTVV